VRPDEPLSVHPIGRPTVTRLGVHPVNDRVSCLTAGGPGNSPTRERRSAGGSIGGVGARRVGFRFRCRDRPANRIVTLASRLQGSDSGSDAGESVSVTRVVPNGGGPTTPTDHTNEGLIVKKLAIATLFGGLSVASVGLAGPAAAAPNADDAVNGLRAQGYSIQLNGSPSANLSACAVTGVNTDSPGASSNPVAYVDIACPTGC
jgi:hypothetical protein